MNKIHCVAEQLYETEQPTYFQQSIYEGGECLRVDYGGALKLHEHEQGDWVRFLSLFLVGPLQEVYTKEALVKFVWKEASDVTVSAFIAESKVGVHHHIASLGDIINVNIELILYILS